MTTGEKIAKHRKELNMTQEQLADTLEVSRQSVSKWESNLAFPETDKLVLLSRLFSCTVDYLLKDELNTPERQTETILQSVKTSTKNGLEKIFSYEYISPRRLGKLPLVHITLSPKKTARGILALGWRSCGILSIGLLSLGILSVGVLSVGIIALGTLVLGLLAFGALAVGGIAIGGIACGILAMGGVAIGLFSLGGAAIGNYFAYGDHAIAKIAIGKTRADGSVWSHVGETLSDLDRLTAIEKLRSITPRPLARIAELIQKMILF